MNQRDAGFTLLEMLVALVVFGLIMAGIAQNFRFGLTAWSATLRNTATPDTMLPLDAALTRMIADALPGSMEGGPDALAFTTTLPPGAGVKGLADIAIRLAPDHTLILRYAPHPPGIPLAPLPAPKTELLGQSVARLSLTYLVAQQSGPPFWSNRFSGHGLPLLIRLHLQPMTGPVWPDLVAAPVNPGN